MAVTACAVLLFTVPLAWAVAEVYRRGAVVLLQRDAISVAESLVARPGSVAGGLAGSAELPHGVDAGVYGPGGRRIAGEGPAASPVAGLARDGGLHQGIEVANLAVAAPVVRGGRVVAAVRVWVPWDSVTDRRMRAWLLLAGLGSVVVAWSGLPAWRLARRVAVPLERLTTVARALGDGDFTVQAPRTDIREADLAGRALAATARRLGEVLERERRFSTAVSHQLRTPLTALVLGLEAAQGSAEGVRREAVALALRRAEHLAETVDEVLRLARETHRAGAGADAGQVAEQVACRYRAAAEEAGRRLVVRCERGLAPVTASEAALAQILGTLLDNALVHGRGEIRVSVADVGTGVAVEVGDDGAGLLPAGGEPAFTGRSPGARHGIGLPLARSLAEAEGGRLVVRRAGPRPVFSVLLPFQVPSEVPSELPSELAEDGSQAVTGAKSPAGDGGGGGS
jgi:signal transduction histidine kinase